MTYDSWKCTDPNDQWLGDSIDAAYARYHDGEITLADLGEILLESGLSPHEVRIQLTEEAKYPIPKGYFGKEIEDKTFDEAGSSDEAFDHFSRQK